MSRALVFGAAALVFSSGAAAAQSAYPSHDSYAAGPALAAPLGYGPLVYAALVYAPTPAFPAPLAKPGYYTVHSVVASQPLYDYAPGYWNRSYWGRDYGFEWR